VSARTVVVWTGMWTGAWRRRVHGLVQGARRSYVVLRTIWARRKRGALAPGIRIRVGGSAPSPLSWLTRPLRSRFVADPPTRCTDQGHAAHGSAAQTAPPWSHAVTGEGVSAPGAPRWGAGAGNLRLSSLDLHPKISGSKPCERAGFRCLRGPDQLRQGIRPAASAELMSLGVRHPAGDRGAVLRRGSGL
jgi:hypothetical protein